MLAMAGLWNTWRSFGSSSPMTACTPGFCRPTLLISPWVHSAMRGRGLPKRGDWVVPFRAMLPSTLIS